MVAIAKGPLMGSGSFSTALFRDKYRPYEQYALAGAYRRIFADLYSGRFKR
jgi:hypothetical protein